MESGTKTLTMPWATAVAVGCVLLAAGVASCRGETLASRRCGQAVVVDARNEEWQGAVTTFDKEHVGVGLMNDATHLHVAFFVADERLITQILTGGVTVWFDPQAKNEKRFGLRYPLGVTEDARPAFMRALREGGRLDSLAAAWNAISGDMEILERPDEPGRRVPVGAEGIDIAAAVGHGEMIWELRLPLLAIAAPPGEIISVGIETAPVAGRGGPPGGMGPGAGGGFPGGRGGPGEGPPGGGPPGMGGGRPGGGPPRGPGDRPEPLNLWMSVLLDAATRPE